MYKTVYRFPHEHPRHFARKLFLMTSVDIDHRQLHLFCPGCLYSLILRDLFTRTLDASDRRLTSGEWAPRQTASG